MEHSNYSLIWSVPLRFQIRGIASFFGKSLALTVLGPQGQWELMNLLLLFLASFVCLCGDFLAFASDLTHSSFVVFWKVRTVILVGLNLYS